jgi:hypothetical protein
LQSGSGKIKTLQEKTMESKKVFVLSWFLGGLIVTASCVGLMIPDFYGAETLNWQAQSIGQDMIDLFLIVPCLLISSIFAFRNNRIATMIWGGVMLYLSYTFVIYCFDIHFNSLFVVYCLCLGLSFYSFMYFLLTLTAENRKENFENKSEFRFAGFYFIIISIVFYFLWLSEIIPSISQHKIPKSVTDAGLFTNAVHVLDLAVILPTIFMTGVFLLRKKPIGIILSPVLLTFFVLMDITIGTLIVIMKIKGLETELSISILMGMLALISLVLLIKFLRRIGTAGK